MGGGGEANPATAGNKPSQGTRPEATGPVPGQWGSSGWRLGEELGEGNFATVHVALHPEAAQRAAVKVIPRANSRQANVRLELAIMKQISATLSDNRHLVHLIDVFEDDRNLYLVMELCRGPVLSDLLMVSGSMSEAMVANAVRHVALALLALHSEGIVHRDLKPENLMWQNACTGSPLQVVDFGLGCLSNPENSDSVHDKEIMGTTPYIAPEVFASRSYSSACDIWSLGVIAYQLLCGRLPFENRAQIALSPLHFSGPEWDAVSEDAKLFIRWALQRVPSKRPTAREILDHPWLLGNASEAKLGEDEAQTRRPAELRHEQGLGLSNHWQCLDDELRELELQGQGAQLQLQGPVQLEA